ncbi:type II toxin-antitoxin system RelB/DinJ family antitoxin [Loigolactobacillus binensis]|uniref:Type II toxin-antitoxin system RelB/DinJ family antitoxin n=1 Tax=Loigolactobacillus binensis TaxID=2559922 RepID=A0ABW3EB75_9LACO|nr:type II toxin-antitoxin system RelB/DinJ family antitoxin [Loigolactobacillus binensis]
MQETNKKVSFTIRVNAQTKKKADQVAESLGISLTAAINMFVEQFAREKGMPFTPTANLHEHTYSEAELELMFVDLLKQRVKNAIDQPGLPGADLTARYVQHRTERD